jgi:hypothetical protein
MRIKVHIPRTHILDHPFPLLCTLLVSTRPYSALLARGQVDRLVAVVAAFARIVLGNHKHDKESSKVLDQALGASGSLAPDSVEGGITNDEDGAANHFPLLLLIPGGYSILDIKQVNYQS